MTTEDLKIHIVGAGVSGLVAAKILEDYGFSPCIIEATDRPGGRVKTDVVNGYQLDHGFQVLLTEYPAAQKYLDFDALELQEFKSGAAIFINGKQKIIGDPLRDLSVLFSTIFSGIGNLSDKVKILRLTNRLKKKSLEEIFKTKEITTKEYLVNFGFSSQMITSFFQPFFTGIFLETDLETSSRMFEFVFKMFGEGLAVLPKGGIEEIPKQLTNNLKRTSFLFNTKVTSISNQEIKLSTGEKLTSDAIIITTDANKLIKNLKGQYLEWKSCQTLYFTTKSRKIAKPFIGLLANKDSLINNVFYHTSIETKNTSEAELLSVTVVKEHHLSEKELIEKVSAELKTECNIEELKFLKLYNIPKALPNLNNLQYEVSPSETQLTDSVFLAGDIQLNGSLNAAMISGEKAALGVLENLKKIGVIL
tara:strand:- start:1486 stop:2745 length:1260 start_codon:yes stop_codon:yes gene_type:complete